MTLAPKTQRKKFGNGEILQEAEPKAVSAISSCLNSLQNSWKKKGNLAGIWKDWKKLTGPQLSQNSQPLSLRRGILVIGASHPEWLQALQYNRLQLLAAFKTAGYEIRDIRIQQHYPKIARNKKESEESIWAKHPSRIDIHGLAICKACKCPSPKGEISLWGICSFCRQKELNLERKKNYSI